MTRTPRHAAAGNSNGPVALLRAELRRRRLAGLIVPRQDEFGGEEVAAYAERLRWLTGFTGSWGLAILTLRAGAIFVDGRYTTQVRNQIDTRLFAPLHLKDDPPDRWIAANVRKGERLGFDPWLLAAGEADRFARACAASGAKLVAVAGNPIDAVWQEQPARPQNPVSGQPTQLAGRRAADKLKGIRKTLGLAAADATVLTDPCSIAWLFNIRGRDIAHAPVVLAYAIIHRRARPDLFIAPGRIDKAVRSRLGRIARLVDPGAIDAALAGLGRRKARVLLDPDATPCRIRDRLKSAGATIIRGPDPCLLPKARKNRNERQGARAAQLRDGLAVARFLCWLETAAPTALRESEAAARLDAFRLASKEYLGPSFETIAAAGAHAAIPHYRVTPATDRPLKAGEIFLIDSGGQYRDGTTDITRTTVIGQPTENMRDRFTRVLKGMMAVSRLRFPTGTAGSQIDATARSALWAAGLDYDHGTGHGVGSYLSVHEGPARINKSDRTPLEPGMILSNEPGYYKAGHYGIRIENLLMVREAEAIAGGERPMLGFETLTLCPIERRLVDRHLLTKDDVIWFDSYHARVLKELAPHLSGAELAWLQKACAPLA
ncbi:MAG: aminopeptidase P family protein [Rhizobiales bacterium]|nr:aminopeptidase P family protein [Hyphomicrobiales bacterium]